MPKWVHDRAQHLMEKDPNMPASEAWAIAYKQRGGPQEKSAGVGSFLKNTGTALKGQFDELSGHVGTALANPGYSRGLPSTVLPPSVSGPLNHYAGGAMNYAAEKLRTTGLKKLPFSRGLAASIEGPPTARGEVLQGIGGLAQNFGKTVLASADSGVAKKKNPELWSKAKSEAKAQLGGKWSARAAQLAVQKYKEDGGKYVGKKPSSSKNSLVKWTKQEWQTRPGTPEKAERGGVTHRYLPKDKWDSLSKGEQAATDRKKVQGDRRGEDIVPNTAAAKVKSAMPKGKLEKNPVGADEHRSSTGGLTAAGRAHFARTEGARLKPGVKEKNPTGEKARRKGSFLTRFFTNPRGPMEDEKGRPTRLALSAQAWGESVPKSREDAARLAAKGRKLLGKSKEASPHLELQHDPSSGMPEPEGGMARSRLHHITDTAGKLREMIHEEDHLPAWVTDHITSAHENLSQVNSYIEPKVHELEFHKKVAMITELYKLGAVSEESAQQALNRYEALERSKLTPGQVGRYAAIGAVAAPAISAASNFIRGGHSRSSGISYLGHLAGAKTPGISGIARGLAASSATGALSSGAIPLVRSGLDRRAEMSTLKKFLQERSHSPETPQAGKLESPVEPAQSVMKSASKKEKGSQMLGNTPAKHWDGSGIYLNASFDKEAFNTSMYDSGMSAPRVNQVSGLPTLKSPSLTSPLQKLSGNLVGSKEAMATTPAGRLLSARRVGQPKVSPPSGPSVADQVPTWGQRQPGANKTTIGKRSPKYSPTIPEAQAQQSLSQ